MSVSCKCQVSSVLYACSQVCTAAKFALQPSLQCSQVCFFFFLILACPDTVLPLSCILVQADPAEDDDDEKWDTASMTHDQRQKRKQMEMNEEAPERKRPRSYNQPRPPKGSPPGSVSAILNQNKEYPTLEQTWRKAQQEYLVKMATKLAEAESFLHGGLESACLSFTGPGLHWFLHCAQSLCCLCLSSSHGSMHQCPAVLQGC